MALLGAVGTAIGHAEPPAGALTPGGFSAADTGTEVDAMEQLKAGYCADIDAKNWDGLRQLLAEDVVVDTTASAGPVIVGRDPFIAFLKTTLGAANTHHQVFDPQITVHSATSAEGVWRMEDVLIFGGTLGVHGYGHYTERYENSGSGWVIAYSKLTRTRIDLINPADGSVIQSDVSVDEVAAKIRAIIGG
ncbi:nuclear transport factor 2 family protein [Nocardia blacklockiae]|uniref:nuclear transport factor 2 family protein n=1 Tax=Nocardia blacklockiae TaxID=480036 RepID=UPI0018959A88|nr:nuclear transport factor 2 family protein [Nocardia blacklockiae]MBF6175163.1 nuclear transport factor 2 family protein [Nocardia blacklockiae]